MHVTYSDNWFMIYWRENLLARIKTNETIFDEIISLFLCTSVSETKKKTNKIRFE